MTYSAEQLKTIEKLASLYVKISDIADIIGVPAAVLREDIACDSPEASQAYRKGKAASRVNLHAQEMRLAQIGSPLGIENVRQSLMEMEEDE
ncbi:MAG: hypothetical protein HDS67_02290 [Bacteroidales bacterium]|nr:hypothetical protein [Bacteroidales bacterium]